MRPALGAALALAVLLLWTHPVRAALDDFQVFTSRAQYSAVLLQQGRVQVDADWNEQEQGSIHPGEAFSIFRYAFDEAAVRPAVGSGIVSGLAVGAEPDGTLGGDQGFSLVVTPGLALDAFGAEITVAPFGGPITAGMLRVVVDCPDPPCVFAGNPPDLFPNGGSFFLGIVAPSGVTFDRITLEAVTPRDEVGEPLSPVPGWQVAAITFAPVRVPAPPTVILIAVGVCWLAVAYYSATRISA